VNRPTIALLTDFGEDDFFVPSLKGVIASINAEATIIDITHTIPSFDILAGSFVLSAVYRYFPSTTVFVAVIDPGVGTSRKILLAESAKYFFIAPDNGILSPILVEEKDVRIRSVVNEKYFLPSNGVTFEGRDKMVPAAAWLSQGISPAELGPEIQNYKKIQVHEPVQKLDGIQGSILYRDKFGNLITNIPSSILESFAGEKEKETLRIHIEGDEIPWRESYSQGKEGEVFFVSGSLGLIEIAVREGSAAERLKVSPGQMIELMPIPKKT